MIQLPQTTTKFNRTTLKIQQNLLQYWKNRYSKPETDIDLSNYVQISENLPKEIILHNLKDIAEIIMPIVIPFMEDMSAMKEQIILLKDEIDTLKEKEHQQNLQQLKEQSQKNALELRELVGLGNEFGLIDPKKTLFEILSEYQKEDDSLEILKTIRNKD